MKITAIALNTFKEAIRDRILALLAVGDRVKIIIDVGLASLSLFGALMAILMGTSLVFKEIDKKTIYTLLSKPIHRYQFLLGKFLGLIMTLLVMLFLMSLIFIVIVLLHSGRIEWGMFAALAFIFLELCLITAVAMFFSCISSPILSSVFSLSFYLIGHLIPDLENFNFKTETVHHLPVPPQVFLYATIYGVMYTLFVLAAAMLVFRKRDFAGFPEKRFLLISMKKKFLVILLILSCTAFMGLKIKLDNIPRKTVPGSSFIYIPSGKFLKYATFGYSSLMADLIYVWSIQYFSDQKIPNRFDYLDHVFSIIAELDPHYFDAYQVGAIFAVYDARDFRMDLSLSGRPLRSDVIKGLQNSPKIF